jgi:hypothetical protein
VSEEEGFKVTDRRGRGDLSSAERPGSAEAASSLGALFMMFANSGLISLGAVPDPETDERRLDLGEAQAAIDVLLMLRDKTRGNRSEQESRLLEDVLYDLQMRFVRAAPRSSPPSAS